MRVCFKDFWRGFTPTDFFIPLLTDAFNEKVIITDEDSAQIVMHSVFQPRSLKQRIIGSHSSTSSLKVSGGRKNVWYTAENVRPRLDLFDLTLSFETDTFGGKNVYLPYAVVSMSWWTQRYAITEEELRVGTALNAEEAKLPRNLEPHPRPLFACAFVGNPEPIRMEAIRQLSSIGQVDIFGAHTGKPVPSKMEIASNYRFMLAFENDVYPGYVTEKALQAWACGCIPIWRGADANRILNPSAVVNSMNFATMEEMVNFIRILDRDDQRLERIRSEQILASHVTLNPAKSALRNLFKS